MNKGFEWNKAIQQMHCDKKLEEKSAGASKSAVERMVMLPTDCEIERIASEEAQQDWDCLRYAKIYKTAFIDGAKWMRDEAGKAV